MSSQNTVAVFTVLSTVFN